MRNITSSATSSIFRSYAYAAVHRESQSLTYNTLIVISRSTTYYIMPFQFILPAWVKYSYCIQEHLVFLIWTVIYVEYAQIVRFAISTEPNSFWKYLWIKFFQSLEDIEDDSGMMKRIDIKRMSDHVSWLHTPVNFANMRYLVHMSIGWANLIKIVNTAPRINDATVSAFWISPAISIFIFPGLWWGSRTFNMNIHDSNLLAADFYIIYCTYSNISWIVKCEHISTNLILPVAWCWL